MDILDIVNTMQPGTISKLAAHASDFPNSEPSIPFMGFFVQLFPNAVLPDPAAVTAYAATYQAAALAAQLLAALAAHRYTVQTGGIVVAGVPVSTDEVSLAKLSDAWIKSKFDNTITVSWVAGGNVYPLNAAQILTIGDAVFTFQQKCYAAQAALIPNVAQYQDTASIIAAFDNAMKG